MIFKPLVIVLLTIIALGVWFKSDIVAAEKFVQQTSNTAKKAINNATKD